MSVSENSSVFFSLSCSSSSRLQVSFPISRKLSISSAVILFTTFFPVKSIMSRSSVKITGKNTIIISLYGYATESEMISAFFTATLFGIISQKTSIRKVISQVATATARLCSIPEFCARVSDI
jgi:hypothetical protein